MIRLLLAAAIVSSVVVTVSPRVSAQQPPPSPPAGGSPEPSGLERLREEQRAYMGRNVRVHRTDGTIVIGRLIGETSEGLAVQPSPSDEPVLVRYDEIESIAAGMRRWQKIAIGLAVAGAALAAIVLN
jgi:hypothetical protein